MVSNIIIRDKHGEDGLNNGAMKAGGRDARGHRRTHTLTHGRKDKDENENECTLGDSLLFLQRRALMFSLQDKNIRPHSTSSSGPEKARAENLN